MGDFQPNSLPRQGFQQQDRMTRISANFDLLGKHDAQLVRLGALAERYFKQDTNTCLTKLTIRREVSSCCPDGQFLENRGGQILER
jgi:type I restriction enzyme, R subunit